MALAIAILIVVAALGWALGARARTATTFRSSLPDRKLHGFGFERREDPATTRDREFDAVDTLEDTNETRR